MMMKVSVLMTVYNGMPFLKKSVQSILNQTYTDFELIIVDDGSTDGSLEFLKIIQDSRVQILNGGRIGRGKALNLGLKHCRGQYVAINDADDISLPDRIKQQVQFMESYPAYGILGSLSSLKDYTTGEIKIHSRPISDTEIRLYFTKGQPIQHVTVLFRKDAMDEVGGYNESIPFLFDRDIFIRIGKNWKMHNLPLNLVEVGHHSNRYFYFTYKGLRRERLSLKYRIKAILDFNFPLWYLAREMARSIWIFMPLWFRKSLILLKKKIWKK